MSKRIKVIFDVTQSYEMYMDMPDNFDDDNYEEVVKFANGEIETFLHMGIDLGRPKAHVVEIEDLIIFEDGESDEYDEDISI